jgi:phosphatidylserine decarboxylase
LLQEVEVNLHVAKEVLPWILTAVVISATTWILTFISGSRTAFAAAIVLTLATVTVAFFFRDPDRIPSAKPENAILSPADGKVIAIQQVEEREFLRGKALKISIFLSLTNVHINRIPLAGVVKYKNYHPGKFALAFRDKASEDNENMLVGIECGNGLRIAVKQIAGFVARRIICKAQIDKTYGTGERYGLICFGSRTELFLPVDTKVTVKPGDRVRGGLTIIGERL